MEFRKQTILQSAYDMEECIANVYLQLSLGRELKLRLGMDILAFEKGNWGWCVGGGWSV